MKSILQLFLAVALLFFSACKNIESASPANTQKLTSIPSATVQDTVNENPVDTAANVWICKSAGAKRYHLNRNCGGLGRCKHTVEEMSVTDAEAVGLTKCSYKKCN
jgi:hypothetical protein